MKKNNNNTSKLFDVKGLSRKGRKVIGATTKPRLLTITEPERQRLLSSRVANILEEKSEDCNVYLTDDKRTFEDIPKRLNKYREKDCPLWNKASNYYEPNEEELYLKKLNESNEKKQVYLYDNVTSNSNVAGGKNNSKKSSTCVESEVAASSSTSSSVSTVNKKNTPVKAAVEEYELFESSDCDDDDGIKSNEIISNDNSNSRSCGGNNNKNKNDNQKLSRPSIASSISSTSSSTSPSSKSAGGMLKNLFPVFSSSQRFSKKGREKKESLSCPSTNVNGKEDSSSSSHNIHNISGLTDDSDFEGPPKKIKTEKQGHTNLTTAINTAISSSSSSVPWTKKLKLDKVSPYFNVNNNNTSFGTSSKASWKPTPVNKSDHSDLSQDFLSLFLEKIDADVTIYGREEKAIRAHKLILKVRCPKLLKEVVTERQKGSKREVIPLTCYSHDAVKSLLCYIYCGRILPPPFNIATELSESTLEEIVSLGDKYGLDLSLQKQDVVKTTPKLSSSNKIGVAEKSIQTESILSTEEKFIQTEDIMDQVVEDVDMEEHQPKNVDNDDEDEADALMDVRNEERSFDYHHGKSFNYSFNEDLNRAYNNSLDLVENSFNDKVFANKLEEKTSIRKRRRTWSEKSCKMSMSSDDILSDDSIVVIDQVIGNSSSSKSNKNKESEQNNENIINFPDNNNENQQQSFDSDLDVEMKSSSAADANYLGDDHSDTGDDRVNHDIAVGSIWNDSCDDAFFANLPNDEELFNYPPTSPAGDKTFSNVPKNNDNDKVGGLIALTSTPSRNQSSSPSSSRTIRENNNIMISSLSSLSPISHLTSRPPPPRRKRSPLSQQLQAAGTKKQTNDKEKNVKSRTKASGSRGKGKTSNVDLTSRNKKNCFGHDGDGDDDDDEEDDCISSTKNRQRARKSADGSFYNKRSSISASQGSTSRTPATAASSTTNTTNHTPMLNYSLIDTPILKKELKRYGLKPLPRSKAKLLLRHIYKETHK